MNTGAVNGDGKNDAGILEKKIVFVAERHTQRLILVPILIVVTLLPEDADADEILFQFIGASQVRPGQETQSAGVYLERLVDGKLHREVGGSAAVLFGECIWKQLVSFDHGSG